MSIATFFEFQKENTTMKKEVLAGITSFFATAYIIFVNPIILSNAGMPFPALVTATVIISAFSSIMMGIYAKNPIIIAPGMGLNAFFAFSMVVGMKLSYQVALGAVFWSGIIFIILSIFNVRTKIVDAVPHSLRYAISCGIGLFIALIGLSNGNFVTSSPATIIKANIMTPNVIVFIIGLLITSILIVKKVKGSFLIGIFITTLIAASLGRIIPGDKIIEFKGIYSSPDFSLIGQLDYLGALKFSIFPAIFSFLFTDLFDTLSTFIAVSEAADLKDENGRPRNIKKSFIVDAVSTTLSGFVGTSPGTSFIESAAGVQEGGRTGLVAVVAGILFLPFMFFSPLLSAIPALATAPVLVIVGVYMISPITKINWTDMEEAIPCFIAIILIPLSYSITQGLIWGFMFYTILKIANGKISEVSPTLIFINIFSILALIVH